jgi:hypothetical protein
MVMGIPNADNVAQNTGRIERTAINPDMSALPSVWITKKMNNGFNPVFITSSDTSVISSLDIAFCSGPTTVALKIPRLFTAETPNPKMKRQRAIDHSFI